MKRTWILLAALFALCLPCVHGTGAALEEDFNSPLSSAWRQTASGASIMVEDGAVILQCDTSPDKTASAAILTAPVTNLDRRFALYLQSSLSSDSDLLGLEERSCYLQNTARKLFTLSAVPSDGEIITYLKPFGDGNGNVVFTRGQQHTIALAVDAAADSASFWLDGVQIYHGGVPAWVGSYDFSSTQIYCANTLNVRNAAEKTTKSVWKIGRILADSQQPYAFTSNPESGAAMLNAQTLQTAQLNFGAYLDPSLLQADNILFLAGQDENSLSPAEFTFTVSERGLSLSPAAGFQPNMTYRIILQAVRDLFGTSFDPQPLQFSTSPTGYVPPTAAITSPTEQQQVFAGESLTFTAAVQPGMEGQTIERVEFYRNDAPVSTIYSKPYTASMYFPSAGVYEVYAIAYATDGGNARTLSISVSVLENQAPIVTLPDAGTRGNTAPFTVDAEDADGEVSLVDLFIDGTFFASVSAAPYTFDLSAVSPGPHMLRAVAYDNYGLSGQAEAEYTLLAYTKNLLLNTDLTGYKGGNGTGFAVLDSRNLGYSKGQVIDGSHGTSLVLGAEGDTKEIGPYLYFELGDATPDVVFSCDIYLPDTNATVTSWVRNLENSNCLNLFVFKKGGDIEFWGDGGVAKTAKFLPETWYHAETRLYGTDKTYDCTITTQNPDGTSTEVATVTGRAALGYKNVSVFNVMRLSVTTDGGTGSYAVFDNLRCVAETPLPYFTTEPEVSYQGGEIFLPLSGPLAQRDLNGLVTLRDEIAEVPLLSATYDAARGGLILTTDKLNSNMRHTVTLSEDVPISTIAKLGIPVSGYFRTGPAPFDVSAADFEQTAGKVRFRAVLTNGEQSVRAATVVLTIWNGNKVASASAVSNLFQPGENKTLSTDLLSFPDGAKAEAFITEALADGGVVTRKIWTLSK